VSTSKTKPLAQKATNTPIKAHITKFLAVFVLSGSPIAVTNK